MCIYQHVSVAKVETVRKVTMKNTMLYKLVVAWLAITGLAAVAVLVGLYLLIGKGLL